MGGDNGRKGKWWQDKEITVCCCCFSCNHKVSCGLVGDIITHPMYKACAVFLHIGAVHRSKLIHPCLVASPICPSHSSSLLSSSTLFCSLPTPSDLPRQPACLHGSRGICWCAWEDSGLLAGAIAAHTCIHYQSGFYHCPKAVSAHCDYLFLSEVADGGWAEVWHGRWPLSIYPAPILIWSPPSPP